MNETVIKFRKQLSEKLQISMKAKDSSSVQTLRAIMSAIDNASAITNDEISLLPDSLLRFPGKILARMT